LKLQQDLAEKIIEKIEIPKTKENIKKLKTLGISYEIKRYRIFKNLINL